MVKVGLVDTLLWQPAYGQLQAYGRLAAHSAISPQTGLGAKPLVIIDYFSALRYTSPRGLKTKLEKQILDWLKVNTKCQMIPVS